MRRYIKEITRHFASYPFTTSAIAGVVFFKNHKKLTVKTNKTQEFLRKTNVATKKVCKQKNQKTLFNYKGSLFKVTFTEQKKLYSRKCKPVSYYALINIR